MELNDETVYQYYTVVNDNGADMEDNSRLLTFSDDEEGGQVFYVAMGQENAELEDVEATTNSLLPELDSLDAEQETEDSYDPSMKIVTTDEGHLFLTSNVDANLAGIQSPSLSIVEEDSLIDVKQEVKTEPESNTTRIGLLNLTDWNELVATGPALPKNFREIILEDGTKALIDNDLWNKLLENIVIDESGKKKKFVCNYMSCRKEFATNHHLTVHTRSHTGNKPYTCLEPECDKAFATNYSLKAHMRTHTGEKPYGCGVCLKHFKTSGDLQKHVRIHTGEKPFKCPIEGCTKSFTTSNIRKVHIRSHTGERPYVCKVENCGKSFASATNYKNHKRIHSGERPYECSVDGCGKRFTEYSSLYKHNSVHNVCKSFRCEYCLTFFKLENSLRVHKKSVHNVIIAEDGQEFVLTEEDRANLLLGCTTAMEDPLELRDPLDPLS